MVEAASAEIPAGADAPFIKELVKLWRAQDGHGAWDRKSDLELLEPYILDKEKRAANCRSSGIPIPIRSGTWSLFYNAISLCIERRPA